jgi:hypothetical protein
MKIRDLSLNKWKIGNKKLFSALLIIAFLNSNYQFIQALSFYGDEEMDLSEYWDPKDSDDIDN